MEARGIYWLIVALHGITPEEIEDIPDAFWKMTRLFLKEVRLKN